MAKNMKNAAQAETRQDTLESLNGTNGHATAEPTKLERLAAAKALLAGQAFEDACDRYDEYKKELVTRTEKPFTEAEFVKAFGEKPTTPETLEAFQTARRSFNDKEWRSQERVAKNVDIFDEILDICRADTIGKEFTKIPSRVTPAGNKAALNLTFMAESGTPLSIADEAEENYTNESAGQFSGGLEDKDKLAPKRGKKGLAGSTIAKVIRRMDDAGLLYKPKD